MNAGKEESFQLQTAKAGTYPVEVVDLSEKFIPLITEEAQEAFKTKAANTVFEFNRSSNGHIYITGNVIEAANIMVNEENKIKPALYFNLINRINSLIADIDPGVRREAALARYGQITAEGKLKDIDKLDDEVILKEMADIYNKLIAEKLIYPCVFQCSPAKLELSLYDPINECFVDKKADGTYIGYSSKRQHVKPDIINSSDDVLKLHLDGLREYSEAEAQELTVKIIYMLWVFPFTVKNVVEDRFELNRILGKEFFVPEGDKSQWTINF